LITFDISFDAIIYYYLAIADIIAILLPFRLRHYAITDYFIIFFDYFLSQLILSLSPLHFLFRFYDSSIDFLRAFIIAAFRHFGLRHIDAISFSFHAYFHLRHISFIINISIFRHFISYISLFRFIFIDISLSL
jgi:hypothetical protein